MAAMLTGPSSISETPSIEEQHERSGYSALGLGVAGFEKALEAANAASARKDSAGAGEGDTRDAQEQSFVGALFGSIEQSLEAKSETAQARADLFESRAAEAADPARVEILNKRSEINAERADFLLENSEHVGSLTETFIIKDSEAFESDSLENMNNVIDYHEERAADLTELSDLVRANGNPEWADKLLARAEVSTNHVETLYQRYESYDAVTVDFSEDPTPTSIVPSTEVLGPWLNADSVSAIQTQLNATEEFGTSVVNSVRDISQGEMVAIRDLAVELGADDADLEFFDFVSGELGIKVVFVDDLVSENGAFGAFGGEATIPESEGLGILLDSTFVDIDFDDGISGINEVSAQGGEVFLHEATHILQAFGIVDFSGEVGDGDAIPELSSGETVGQLDGEDQASFVESFAGDFLEDTAVLR